MSAAASSVKSPLPHSESLATRFFAAISALGQKVFGETLLTSLGRTKPTYLRMLPLEQQEQVLPLQELRLDQQQVL